jgi:hypothetical protein
MTTIPIDIPLPDAITQRLTPPACADIQINPPPPPFSLCLPFGGALKAIVDTSKQIPDDCAITFSILLQLPPLMASLGCFIKLLKLAQPIMDFAQAVGNPAKLPQAIVDLGSAVAEIVDCFKGLVSNIPLFIRDLLHLIAKMLKCLGESLKSIANLMSGIQLSIQTAQAAGNQALLQQLHCAQSNAQAQAQAALGQTDVIQLVLNLAQPLLGLMPNAPTIAIPAFGSATDVESLQDTANTMLSVGGSLDQIAAVFDHLGKC